MMAFQAMYEAFLQTDKEFEVVALEDELYCGTTALVILLQGNRCARPLYLRSRRV